VRCVKRVGLDGSMDGLECAGGFLSSVLVAIFKFCFVFSSCFVMLCLFGVGSI